MQEMSIDDSSTNAFRSSTFMVVLTLSVATFTDALLYSIIVPIIPYAFVSRMGVHEDDVQYWTDISLAIYSAGQIVTSPIFGYFSDKLHNGKFLMLAGMTILVVSTIILCAAQDVSSYIVGRFLQGVSGAVVWSVGLAIMADTAPPDKVAFLMGFPSMAVSMGTISGPLVGGIAYQRQGYYAVFLVALGILTIDIALRLIMLEKPTAPRTTIEPEKVSEYSLLRMLKNARIANSLFLSMVLAWQLTALDATMTLHLQTAYQFDSLQSGLMFLALLSRLCWIR
jgi:MFS family permease